MTPTWIQLVGVAVGGLLALAGAFLAHLFAQRREEATRRIEGLRDVAHELEQRRRLTLELLHHIVRAMNMAEREEPLMEKGPEWEEAILSLHARPWMFPCMAYLPAAMVDFKKLDVLIKTLINEHPYKATQAPELFETVKVIEAKIQSQLAILLGAESVK